MRADRRTKRTIQSIRTAFLSLLAEQDLEEITVSQIAQTAGCNRNTFYLHYKGKPALIASLCEDAFQVLHDRLYQSVTGSMTPYERRCAVAQACLEVMDKDRSFYAAILGGMHVPSFQTKIFTMLTELLREEKAGDSTYMGTYYAGALLALLRAHLLDPVALPAEAVMQYII